MRVSGKAHRSIWIDETTGLLQIIDQTLLPHRFTIRSLADLAAVVEAIRTMQVRGAPLIGATAAHGISLAMEADPSDVALRRAVDALAATRPTAINLRWALERMVAAIEGLHPSRRADRARAEAILICDEDVATCAAIGENGLQVLVDLAAQKRRRTATGRGSAASAEAGEASGATLEILTHCNAGWLATVDWGTALAPVYKAHAAGLSLHVWVDETRPRNQGASLTAFELREQGIPHTVIVDNAGGHLMQRGLVDVVLVGSDRTTATGDVCNKIGTYLKALAAKANAVPFYVALPVSSIDWSIDDGLASIPIEERSAEEVRTVQGRTSDGRIDSVELFTVETPVANPAFDVTPAEFVTGLITEHGVFAANLPSLRSLRSRIGHELEHGPGRGHER